MAERGGMRSIRHENSRRRRTKDWRGKARRDELESAGGGHGRGNKTKTAQERGVPSVPDAGGLRHLGVAIEADHG